MFPDSLLRIDLYTKEIIPISLKPEGDALIASPARHSPGDGEQYYISPGFIDLHTHVLDAFTLLGVKADTIGWRDGVHVLADAGSAGSDTANAFPEYIFPANKTPIKVWLNINATGIVDLQECRDLRFLNVEKCAAYARSHRDWICGVKVRTSADVVGDQGIRPLMLAKQAAREAELPLMVHVGREPPTIEDVLHVLEKGDVVSHFLHGKNNRLFDENGSPGAAFLRAKDRGVIFDVAHGAGSFSYETARHALKAEISGFCISTDMHAYSMPGVVKSLSRTMTKLYNLGFPLIDIISGVTKIPAEILGLDRWDDFVMGEPVKRATIFRLRPWRESDGEYNDAHHNVLNVSQVIEPLYVIGRRGTIPEACCG
ncbi:MAG: amidohydrolase family protein [Treponema sp.]|nr:amidohydrolase family protein [Treponema sp.]